ncbi:hypothetical protein HPP92_016678 [Vanilla planifolia]|uniref:Protein kinase domain-containing protein n=1 Tax=Vanilla planifolia TaxID=51239 RepID=A0A835USB0_VANPL|nr:hypothetical protein HPP92_016678 [Vanilla planifolia]
MEKHAYRLLCISLLCLLIHSRSERDNVKESLIAFLRKLAPENFQIVQDLNWSISTDPCVGTWLGVSCRPGSRSVETIVLEGLNLEGSIDADLLCQASSLASLSLMDNSLTGDLQPGIAGCSKLIKVNLSKNRLSGSLPSSLGRLVKLKHLVVSSNNFSGDLPPSLTKILGLISFLADNNHFSGSVPEFNLTSFKEFNISFNELSGPLPWNSEKFAQSSFLGNSGLCGKPLSTTCPTPHKSKKIVNTAVMISGYVLLGLSFVLLLAYISMGKKKIAPEGMKAGTDRKKVTSASGKKRVTPYPPGDHLVAPPSQSATASSMVMLQKVGIGELCFEELLKAPAELLGRGRFGSLYKVVADGGVELAVKRIKDWTVSGEEFQRKMVSMDQVRHPNVLPAIAFYCSKTEKLAVFAFQNNGSLFNLLHDNNKGRPSNWSSRLRVVAGVASGMSFMHRSLIGHTPGHGNLKTSNILFSSAMEPLISEYGLRAIPSAGSDPVDLPFSREADVYAMGIILLEVLTGKLNEGFDLAQWVNAVVREEWTVEVFDRALLAEQESEASEGRMVRLLQVALKCIDPSPAARPTMGQIATMVQELQTAEERSLACVT